MCTNFLSKYIFALSQAGKAMARTLIEYVQIQKIIFSCKLGYAWDVYICNGVQVLVIELVN